MSPSIQCLTRNLLMMSDSFIVPCAPDYFSFEAIRSLQRVIPSWQHKDAAIRQILAGKGSPYGMANLTPVFLGCVLLRYTHRNQTPAKNFQRWIDKIAVQVENFQVEQKIFVLTSCLWYLQVAGKAAENIPIKPVLVEYEGRKSHGLIPALRACQPPMALPDEMYRQIELVPQSRNETNSVLVKLDPCHVLAQLSDFTQLAALSHIHGRPVNALEAHHISSYDEITGKQKKHSGNRKTKLVERAQAFTKIFNQLAKNVRLLAGLPSLN